MTKREREVTDPVEIEEILKSCKVMHLGLVDEGMPYIVPMNYGWDKVDGELVLYLHSGNVGYKLDVIRKNPTCCFEMECDITPFEGRIACQYGITYRSLMGRGIVEFVEDVEEKKHAMSLLMKTQTEKDFAFTDRLVTAVTVLKIRAKDVTAKKRPLPAAMENGTF